jgi:hypothetical protein
VIKKQYLSDQISYIKYMNIKSLTYPSLVLLILFSLTECKKWDLDKRADHNFVTFTRSYLPADSVFTKGLLHSGAEDLIIYGTYSIQNNKDVFLLKVKMDGKEEWLKTYGLNTKNEVLSDCKILTDGSIAVLCNRITDKVSEIGFYLIDQNNGDTKDSSVIGMDLNKYYHSNGFLDLNNGSLLIFGSIDYKNNSSSGFHPIPYITKIQKNGKVVKHFFGFKIDVKYYTISDMLANDDGSYSLLVNSNIQFENSSCYKFFLAANDSFKTFSPTLDSIKSSQPLNVITGQTEHPLILTVNEYDSLAMYSYDGKLKQVVIFDIPKYCSGFIHLKEGGYAILTNDMKLTATDGKYNILWGKDVNLNVNGIQCLAEGSDKGLFITGYTAQNNKQGLTLTKVDFNGDMR